MPKLVRTIDYYTCEFKCRTKAKPLHSIKTHEENCFCNPENKACRICAHCDSSSTEMMCSKLGLHISLQDIKPFKVYNNDGKLIWEHQKTDDDIFRTVDEYNKIQEHNRSRPFPRKNCPHFSIGKKAF